MELPMKVHTTKPIPLEVVQRIKLHLQDSPRELAWFVFSLNTSLRGGDILGLRRSDIRVIDGRTEITLREEKTGKIQTVMVNEETAKILKNWLAVHPRRTDYVFEGERGRMRTPYWSQLLKKWCREVGYDEPRTATHSCRKTFVKTHYQRGTKLAVLMEILNHSTERQTLKDCGVMDEDVKRVFADAI
jgi:integrase